MWGSRRFTVPVGLLCVLCGCDSLWSGLRQTNEDYCPPGTGPECAYSMFETSIAATPNTKLDILFLIDNSPSMSPKQLALAENMPKFIEVLSAIPSIDYHLGIATSDIGSWKAPGTPWGAPLGTCNSYEGDDGMLQAKPCTQRTYIDPNDPAKLACNALCPAGNDVFLPTDGTNFISHVNGQTNVLPAGSGVAPVQAIKNAFQCMALVGDQGCGVEGQLEGAKRALDGHNTANAGFLRPDSLLMVIFLTDEDDCSVQISRRSQNDPTTTDCEEPQQNADWTCFNPDYRCLAMDVRCDQPTNQVGPKSNCTERTDTYLTAVSRYQTFFNNLRPAGNLVIGGIWTTPSIDQGGRFVVTQTSMTNRSDLLNRDAGANAGCSYIGTDPASQGVFGRPQLRLSKFASAFPGTPEVSVCDTDHYPDALKAIGQRIGSRLSFPCLGGLPKLSTQGRPACVVGDVDASTPHGSPEVAFPLCHVSCCAAWAAWDPTANMGMSLDPQQDPGIVAACAATDKSPCYCALPSRTGVCPASQAVAGVWRAGTGTPANKYTNFRCAGQ